MGRLDSVDWNGMVHAISWILLIGFLPPYTPVQTTSKQRPPVNKDHPNLMTIVKYQAWLNNVPTHLQEKATPLSRPLTI